MLLPLPLLVTLSVVGSAILQEIEYYPSRREAVHTGNSYRPTLLSENYRQFTPDSVKQEKPHNKPRKREADPKFHGHPKTREELWNMHFLGESNAYDQTPSLIALLHNITLTYLNDCIPVVLYDHHVEESEGHLIQNLLRNYPVTFFHGRINDDDSIGAPEMIVPVEDCLHFILFLADVTRCGNVIGMQATSKVVVVARSSQWAIQEFLQGEHSRKFVNLLVIAQTFKDEDDTLEAPYILYTHKLYIDGLGASIPVVLTSWNKGDYTRPEIVLFPKKMTHGYAGHRFAVAAANQPPYVVRRVQTDLDGGNPRITWDGVEIRILKLLGEKNNFSVEIIEPKELTLGSGDAVAQEISDGRADIGIGGLYVTSDRTKYMDMSFIHSEDCAVFITLTSTALPRYRAIMGPFHWHVWLAMTLTYLLAIFPLAFSDKHTLRHLLHNGGEVENMFWYVFGTFTNCFTFVGKNSWSKTKKVTTRLLIGWYWIFTIIITACYTGSIIAFVTLPVFPSTVDTVQQLLKGFYRIGTLDRGGWERWFFNSSDSKTNKLLKHLELVPNVIAGLRNTTKAFFWPYAFLGSRAELEYIVQANFSASTSKRNVLHISNECFVPFGVSMAFPNQSLYTARLNADISRMLQSGLIKKIMNEVSWELQRSATGKLLSAGSGSVRAALTVDKGLTLDDTQGMFLLLAAGFLIAAAALMSEWMGGCTRRCRFREWRRPSTRASTGSGNHLITTPTFDIQDDDVLVHDTDSLGNNIDHHIRDLDKESISSRIDYHTSSCSEKSQSTLEGQTIDVTKEDIIIHSTFTTAHTPAHHRSSSADLDREIKEIFEKAGTETRVKSARSELASDRETASKGAFGDHV